jgi:hypothetical protein
MYADSDATQTFVPVNVLHMAISPSPTPHAIAVLHTVAQSDAVGVAEGKYGNDVMVWGEFHRNTPASSFFVDIELTQRLLRQKRR